MRIATARCADVVAALHMIMASARLGLIGLFVMMTPCMAQSPDPFRSASPAATADPFRSAPAATPVKPVARPPPPRPARDAEPTAEPVRTSPTPAAIAAPSSPAQGATPRPSLVGTWKGQAWQWPLVLVVQTDDGETVTARWTEVTPISVQNPQGGGRSAGQYVPGWFARSTVRHATDGSFTLRMTKEGNAIEDVHLCGADLCATIYIWDWDTRHAFVLKRGG